MSKTFKPILAGILLIMAIVQSAYAQNYFLLSNGLNVNNDSLLRRAPCGVGLSNMSFTPSGLVSGYNNNAILTCGKFDFYIDDIQNSAGYGFDDQTISGGQTLGTIRQQTLCAVASYIQSVVDFSNIPSNNHIRINVALSPSSAAYIGQAAPTFTTNSGLDNGQVHDFILSGNDPANANNFHGFLQINFGSGFHNDLSTVVANCEFDLASILLHEMTHVLGFYTRLAHAGPTPIASSPQSYTSIDNAYYCGDPVNPGAMQKLIVNGTVNAIAASVANNNLWLTNTGTPFSIPVYNGDLGLASSLSPATINSYLSHLDEQQGSFGRRTRISPGNEKEFVMGPFGIPGHTRRAYSKEEIRILHTVLGYNYNTSFAGTNYNLLNNGLPYSKRLTNGSLNPDISNLYDYTGFLAEGADKLTPDFTIANTGASLTINLANDNNLTDPDVTDIPNLAVAPGSLFNIRGCGIGGNNHDALTVSANGKQITYTPRADFYGIAQFGFSLTDGKETGGFHVYTIRVNKGNVSLPANGNYILNGGFEEGSEVKRKLTDEFLPNASYTAGGFHEGRYIGAHFSDSHPNDWFSNNVVPGGAGSNIANSYGLCDVPQYLKDGFGYFNSGTLDPALTPSIPGLATVSCGANSGERFQKIFGTKAIYFNLADDITGCKKYKLELDVNDQGSNSFSRLNIAGFTTEALADFPAMNLYNHTTPGNTYQMNTCFTGTGNANWYHISMVFVYPAGTPPASIFYLKKTNPSSVPGNPDDAFFIDNVSITEDLTPPAVTVAVQNSGCYQVLTATPDHFGCNLPLTYTWTVNGVAQNNNTNTITILQTDNYTVTVTDGCFNATYTHNFTGAPNTYINPTASYLLSVLPASGNTVTTANPIIISGTLTVDQNINFTQCTNMLFYPQAKIVINNGRTLGLYDRTNLSGYCDRMWDGIYGSSSTSGLIIDGAFVSDMQAGINLTNNPNFHCTNSTFDNNYISMYLYNTTAAWNPEIKNNQFRTTGSLLKIPYYQQKSMVGIYLYNVQNALIGNNTSASGGNMFDNLLTGIRIESTQPGGNILVGNNQFQNITGGRYGMPSGQPGYYFTDLYNDPEGNAIYGKNTSGSTSLPVVSINYYSGNTNKIQNCTKGVTLYNMNASVQNLVQANGMWGINIGKPELGNYTISKCTMTGQYRGIEFSGTPAAATVADNTISTTTLYNQFFNNANMGVPVGISASWYLNTTHNVMEIRNNLVTLNALGGTGINLQNAGDGVLLFKNTINCTTTQTGSVTLPNPNNPILAGISLNNCVGSSLQGNHLNGNANFSTNPAANPTITTPRSNVAGIYISKSPKLQLLCNHMQDIRTGMTVIDDCTTGNDRVQGNTFLNHQNGMLFRRMVNDGSFGDIGSSDYDRNNQFNGSYYAIQNSNLMKVYTVTLGCSTTNRIWTSNGTISGNQSDGNIGSCKYVIQPNTPPFNISPSCPSIGLARAANIYSDTVSDMNGAEAIAQEQVSYPLFEDGALWLDQKSLYATLHNDPAAVQSSTVLAGFYNDNQQSDMEAIRNTDATLGEIADTTTYTDSIAFAQWLQDAKTAKNVIGNSDQMAGNERVIDDIFIRYMEQGFDAINNTEDSNQIASLALACPYIGGTATFKARMLYAYYVPAQTYTDLEICNDAGVYKGGKNLLDQENTMLNSMALPERNALFAVSPNPTDGKLTVSYQLPAGTNAVVQITDALGRLLIETALPADHTSKQLNLEQLPAGVYYYHCVFNKTHHYTGKISLIK